MSQARAFRGSSQYSTCWEGFSLSLLIHLSCLQIPQSCEWSPWSLRDRKSDPSTQQLWPKALHRNTGDLLFPTELRVKKPHLHFLLFSQHYRQWVLCCLPSPLGTVLQGNHSALLSCSATAVYNLLSSQGRCHICYAGFCCPIPYKGWLIRPLTFFSVPQGKVSTSCPPQSLMTYWSCHQLWLPQTMPSAAPFIRPQKEQERQSCQEFANHRKLRLSNRTGSMVATKTVCSAPHTFPVLQPLTPAVARLLHPATAFRYQSAGSSWWNPGSPVTRQAVIAHKESTHCATALFRVLSTSRGVS